MTQDEIIEMARQVCDIAIDNRGRHTFVCDEYGLEAFANLVAQHTLANIDPSKFISFQEGVETGRLAEREACAKWLENKADAPYLAEQIRARGQA